MTDLKRLWSIRVDEAHERAALETLDAHLRALDEAWAGGLRFKVGAKLAALRRATTSATRSAFAAAYGIAAPNGQWLYIYRLGDEAFARLQGDLAGVGTIAGLRLGYRPGLFVLWASEWFRRCYRGGGHRWEELAVVLGVPAEQNALRALTITGLGQWGRSVIQLSAHREYLGSLAREGGFPTAAVEQGGGGWARDVLAAIVASLLDDPFADEKRALESAEAQRSHLPQLFQDEAFIQLCADLAYAIVRLRREAEPAANAAGIPVLAWLLLHRPAWRETLPLTTGEAAATALVDGLMVVEAVAGGGVGADRLLVQDASGVWREAARITLDGAIDSATMRAIDAREGRLRVFAAGELARALPGELALIEPPAPGESRWLGRAAQRTKGISPVPFAAAIELDLRSGARRVARISLGKPRRGQLLVAVRDSGSDSAPTTLRIVGAGSGKYRATDIYLQTPSDWRVDATAAETVTQLGAGVGKTCLWRVQGGAFVTDATGDRYRILCGQTDDVPARIELMGTTPSWAQVDGDVDLFLGPPIARTSRVGGTLSIRAIGTRDWRPAPGTLPVGHYELGWRDNHVLLDRRRIAVLPVAASLTRSGTAGTAHYDLSGFDEVRIQPDPDAPVAASSDGAHWVSRPRSEMVYRFDTVLLWGDQPPLTVSIDYPCAASIARWDGSVLPDRTQITLNDLANLVAVNRGPMQLVAELSDAQTRARGEMSWDFIDELPMTSVAADLASLLLPASIDATVKLGMHDGIETYWHVRPFEVRLEKSSAGIIASRGVVTPNAELCGRTLVAPSQEVLFGSYSLLSDANHRPVALADDLAGTWLMFLRAGGKILSRPLMVFGATAGPLAQTPLTNAMLLGPREGLDDALSVVLQRASADDADAEAILIELLALIASLKGLPPATFRVLELLACHPGVLARLAMFAAADQRDGILALSAGLPFAWCAIPQSCWDEARRLRFERTFAQLAGLGEHAVRFAMEEVDKTRVAIIGHEPLLASVLLPIRSASVISDVAQAFLNRAHHRVKSAVPDRYRRVLGDKLPKYFLRFSEDVLDTLDAPCAAALAVRGQWVPTVDDVRHIKTVARNFPTYFADAFAASLKEHV